MLLSRYPSLKVGFEQGMQQEVDSQPAWISLKAWAVTTFKSARVVPSWTVVASKSLGSTAARGRSSRKVGGRRRGRYRSITMTGCIMTKDPNTTQAQKNAPQNNRTRRRLTCCWTRVVYSSSSLRRRARPSRNSIEGSKDICIKKYEEMQKKKRTEQEKQ